MKTQQRSAVVRGGQGRTARSVRNDGIGWLVVAAVALGALALLATGGAS
jgi:hypothetical protein